MKKLWLVLAGLALVAVACGGSEVSSSEGDTNADGEVSAGDDPGSDGSDDGGSGAGGSSGGDGSDGSDGSDGGDDDDAPEIVGNEDLDLEELAEIAPDAAEALDEIDDIVSIGECQSETVGLAMSYVPDGWECRVLDQPVGGLDGFTLFMAGNAGGIEITVGTPSPLGPICEALQACDQVEPIDLGSTFNMEVFEVVGVPFISGTHTTVEAEAVVTTSSALSDDDRAFITMVLDGVVEL